MAIELEAPVGEIEEIVYNDGIEDIPNMVAHVYSFSSEMTGLAFCGLHISQDAHAQMQLARGEQYSYTPTDTACGDCGAPVCAACLPGISKGW